jgi:hypothetical protein
MAPLQFVGGHMLVVCLVVPGHDWTVLPGFPASDHAVTLMMPKYLVDSLS